MRKVPDVRRIFYTRLSQADTIWAGCLGSSDAGRNPDVIHVILDVG